jgi:hypothetical protein
MSLYTFSAQTAGWEMAKQEMYKYKMYRASTMEGSGETCNSQVMND